MDTKRGLPTASRLSSRYEPAAQSSPLGAGKRVRLPKCLVSAVRRKFPNPVCGTGCDYWAQCERKGHYTGFRTAEESRAVREGRYQLVDIR